MPKIFISYRRDDAAYVAQSIREKLAARFGKANVFLDVDIPIGVDFHELLSEAVAQCDVLLAIIGDHWLEARDKNGERRLDNPDDWVRIEIEAALSRKIRVIPVLVAKASVPHTTQLPDTLSHLARRTATEVRPGRDFQGHLDRLVRDIAAARGRSLLLTTLGLFVTSLLVVFIVSASLGLLKVETIFHQLDSERGNRTSPTSIGATQRSNSKPSISTQRIVSETTGKPSFSSDRAFEGTRTGDRKELVEGIFFRWCPAGSFTMGSPKTEQARSDDEDQVSVILTKGFWLGETELTQGQWQKLMGTPWKGEVNVREGVNFAASYISYDAATEFIEKLTAQERKAARLPREWKYSLPTEAQWEYACRAETKTKFSFGDDDTKLSEYGWFNGKADNVKTEYVHEVGMKKPNAWGLLDMHGNVWEWCSDWYDTKLQGGQDPQGPASGSDRVYRGGSWFFEADLCRSANRYADLPGYRLDYLGLRLAAVPE